MPNIRTVDRMRGIEAIFPRPPHSELDGEWSRMDGTHSPGRACGWLRQCRAGGQRQPNPYSLVGCHRCLHYARLVTDGGTVRLPRFSSVQAAIVVSALVYAGAAAGSPAHVRIAGPLQSQPASAAPATGAVKAGALVDIVERKGFWAHVHSGALNGWLKLSRLSMDSGGSGNNIAALASGRTGSNNVVSASGGRGLDGADLARAKPDNASVAALSRTAASEAAAEQFAKSGQLKTRHVAYLREPGSSGGGRR
jgi:hypothetical protein